MNRKDAEKKARALVGKMTLREKASQLRFDSPAIERLGIPAYNWWNEALHGVARGGTATSFPQAIGLAATFDEALLEKLGDAAATEGRAKYNQFSARGDHDIYHGLSFWSPNINIFRDPRWGRGHETYGEDPCLTSRLGQAYVHGLQGRGEVLKTAACAKHFAVHSGPEALRHQFNAVATPKDMEETYLPAFEDLVRLAHVESVMGAYNRTNGEPCCASPTLMKKLRGDWGFEGHFVSDCWAIRDFHEGHRVTKNAAESAALALKTGCDLNCGNSYQCLMSAYEQDLITEEDITEAAVRLFTTRYLLGILDGESSEYDRIPYSAVECDEHLRLSHQAALESCVLLKNTGLLPLRAEGVIGVIGPNANSRGALIGNYYGTSSRYVSVLEGIQDRVEGKARVLYSEGCHLFLDRVEPLAQSGDRLAEAVAVAENSDVVVLVLGGSAIDVSQAQEQADAVLLAWYPGARGGKAVAELLFGDVSPCGKLPVTFYRNDALGEMPAFTDYAMTNRTYRYYTGTPLYPFGYGLSYADIAMTSLSADRSAAEVTVENRSAFPADEVVQLYIKDRHSPDAPLHPLLCGFSHVSLEAGERRRVRIPIDPRAFTVVSAEGTRMPGSGEWTLYAGFGQPDALTEKLTGKPCLSAVLR